MNDREKNDLRPLAGSLPIALLRAREVVMARFRPLLAERGFTEQQWRVLRVLFEQGTLEPSEIAERSVIMAPSVTRILKTLEDRGMVSRTMDAKDRRRYLISLTEEAKAAVVDAIPGSNAAYKELERVYGAEKLAELIDVLNSFTDIADMSKGQKQAVE